MRLSGSIPALVTPFQASGAVDLTAFGALIDWHLSEGSSGLVVAGSTGESGALEEFEVAALAAVAVERARGRVPVIVGAGGSATHQAQRLARLAAQVGADAVLATTPSYSRPTQGGLLAHYRALAHSSSLPLILYNVPGRTGVDLLPETVAELATLPKVIAIKEAVADPERMRALLRLRRDGFAVLSGDDPTALRSLSAGADGVISVVANLVPHHFAALCRTATESKLQAAAAIDAMLAPLYAAAGLESNPIPVKAGLAMLGRIQEVLRLPLTNLSPEHRAPLRAALGACAPQDMGLAA